MIAPEKANETLERIWSVLAEASEYSSEHTKTIDASTSLYDFFLAEGEKLRDAGEIDEYEYELLLGMSQMWGAYVGDRVERQSLKFFFLEDCIEGGEI